MNARTDGRTDVIRDRSYKFISGTDDLTRLQFICQIHILATHKFFRIGLLQSASNCIWWMQ